MQVSTHVGRLVRLWDARSGRRLAASEARRELTACAAAAGLAAVGDVAGTVSLSRRCRA
jgi:H+/Cl- antiporter ClcA